MLIRPKLSKGQYRFFASSLRTMSEGIILGSSAAFFLPETLQLRESISIERYATIFLTGLLILIFGAILERKGERHD